MVIESLLDKNTKYDIFLVNGILIKKMIVQDNPHTGRDFGRQLYP